MDQRPSDTDSGFRQLLEELKTNSKIDVTSSLLHTAYAREEVGKDNDKREEQLADMNKTLEKILKKVSGEDKERGKIVRDDEESETITLKDELKSFVAGIKSIGGGVATIAKSPIKAARVGAKQAGRAMESAVTGFEDILETPKDFSIQKQPTAKETIQKTKPVSVNPEADNVETPAEKMADAAEDNLKIQEQLLDTTKQSLTQLIAIKDALSAPQKETPAPKAKETPQIVDQSGSPIGSGMDIDIGKGKTAQKGKPAGGKPQSKPTLGSKVGGALKGAGKAALGAARFLGPVGAVAGAAVGAYQGVSRAGEIFGVEEGKEATFGQKAAAAVGGITDPFGLGYGDSISKGIGSFFNVGDPEARQAGGPVTQGKPYLVGEEGPEVIVPSAAGKVSPTEAKTIDLGGGKMKKINPDGSYEIRDASGTKKYDTKGNLVSEVSPRFAGTQTEKFAAGGSETSYSSDGVSASQRTSATGDVVSSSASVDLGLAKLSSVEAGGRKSVAAELRTGTDENIMLRDEMSAGKGMSQPIVSNNVSNTSTNNYIPMKADPRPTHRGSALENYNNRITAY